MARLAESICAVGPAMSMLGAGAAGLSYKRGYIERVFDGLTASMSAAAAAATFVTPKGEHWRQPARKAGWPKRAFFLPPVCAPCRSTWLLPPPPPQARPI